MWDEHHLWKCLTAIKMRLVCLMLCIVVESVGAVKCHGVKEHKSVACLLCLEPLVLPDQEFDEVLRFL